MRYDYSNSNNNSKFDDNKNQADQHPVWRGIGFLIMLIIPVVSFGLAEIALSYLKGSIPGFVVPKELRTGPIHITADWEVVDLWAVIVIAFVFAILLLTIFVIFNTLIFGMTKNRKKDIFEANKKDFKSSKKNMSR